MPVPPDLSRASAKPDIGPIAQTRGIAALLGLLLVGASPYPALAHAPASLIQDPAPTDPSVARVAPSAQSLWLTRIEHGPVTCNGVTMQPAYSEAFAPLVTAYGPASQTPNILTPHLAQQPSRSYATARLAAFSIGPDGTVRSIRSGDPAPDAPAPIVGSATGLSDQDQATLAAWRFAPSRDRKERTGCQLTLTRTSTPLGQAAPRLLAQVLAQGDLAASYRTIIRREFTLPPADCASGPRSRLTQIPNDKISTLPPGAIGQTLVRYDVDKHGGVAAAAIAYSTDDAAYDAEVMRAVNASTFQTGPERQNCVVTFRRRGPDMPAPPVPDFDRGKACPASVQTRYTPGPLNYPKAFEDRHIEGWAIIRYDLASWGEVGNVRIIDFQPAQAFGDAAKRLIASGRMTPGENAATNCTQIVRFTMPGSDKAGSDEADSQ